MAKSVGKSGETDQKATRTKTNKSKKKKRLKKGKVGRPMKYKHFILMLEEDGLFTPAAIADDGENKGFVQPFIDGDNYGEVRRRIRHTLARLSQNHDFPKEGDGMINREGQQPQRGWYGWRWKMATRPGANTSLKTKEEVVASLEKAEAKRAKQEAEKAKADAQKEAATKKKRSQQARSAQK